MLTVIYVLGALGGIMTLFSWVVEIVDRIVKRHEKYLKYKAFYVRNHKEDDVKIPMGFRTEKEQAEIEARVAKKG